MAKQGANSPTFGENGMLTEPGEVSQMLSDIVQLSRLPKVATDEELQERIDWYFQYCIKNDIRPGVEGMALACGVNRRTLWDWETGYSRSGSRRGEIIRQAKQQLAAFLEKLTLYGKINPVSAIFMAKNHFGYQDKTELEIAPSNALGQQLTPEEIAKRIPKDIPIDVEYTEPDSLTTEEIVRQIPYD